MFVTLITQAIKFGIVFLFGSTGEIIIEKSGHLNLGIPGVMCFGAIGGCLGANLAKNAGLAAGGIVFVAILMAMLFGAMMGARTCAPAMEIISDTARSNIPALGYAGTYAIANVLLTLAGTIIVMVWPGLG